MRAPLASSCRAWKLRSQGPSLLGTEGLTNEGPLPGLLGSAPPASLGPCENRACGGGLCGPSQSPCITPSGAVTLRVPLLYLTQRAKKRKGPEMGAVRLVPPPGLAPTRGDWQGASSAGKGNPVSPRSAQLETPACGADRCPGGHVLPRVTHHFGWTPEFRAQCCLCV